MSELKPKLSLKELLAKALDAERKLERYALVGFMVFVLGLYGFVLVRINNLTSQSPSSDAVNSQVKAAQIPHINEALVKQLQSLQDNSVDVQSLFDHARSNPFQ